MKHAKELSIIYLLLILFSTYACNRHISHDSASASGYCPRDPSADMYIQAVRSLLKSNIYSAKKKNVMILDSIEYCPNFPEKYHRILNYSDQKDVFNRLKSMDIAIDSFNNSIYFGKLHQKYYKTRGNLSFFNEKEIADSISLYIADCNNMILKFSNIAYANHPMDDATIFAEYKSCNGHRIYFVFFFKGRFVDQTKNQKWKLVLKTMSIY